MQFLKLLFLFLPCAVFGQQLGFALEQINGQAILDANLTGKGVKIGVIDGGFLKANSATALEHLFENNLIAGYKDYLDSTAAPYSGSFVLDDGHGTEVLQNLGGIHKERSVQHGLATEATYYLARTDHGAYERRSEEYNAIRAIEWMAKNGVRIINLSLGYNFGFKNKAENYLPSQMDGKTALLTRAVEMLAKKYDLLIVVAAGNDGNKKWRIVGSPADAPSALTVGATKYKTWDKMNYSSEGSKDVSYIKPEVSCYAGTGTSFSAPIITGLAASLLEKKPDLSAVQLKQLLISSAHLTTPNNYLGYGVPDAAKALAILTGQKPRKPEKSASSTKNTFKLSLPESIRYAELYHKSGWKVMTSERKYPSGKPLKIKKPAGITSTTIIWEGDHLELEWKEP